MLCSEGRKRRIWTLEACVDRRLGRTPRLVQTSVTEEAMTGEKHRYAPCICFVNDFLIAY